MSDNILEVKKLQISFRTNNGTVKAVRDISFDLKHGETLAIVGESGSGKSVTSKAILGILAGNSIVDGGEIIYDGKDLLKIDESEMHKLRGDKIAMVFQDPLSSLNPIVKIGKQITEAMIIKNKYIRRLSRKEFNSLLAVLSNHMCEATNHENDARIKELVNTFNLFNVKALQIENDYNESVAKAEQLISLCDDFLFLASKNVKVDVAGKLKEYNKLLVRVNNPFLVTAYSARLEAAKESLNEAFSIVRGKRTIASTYSELKGEVKESVISEEIVEIIKNLKALLTEVTSATKPNFFRIGYFLLRNPQEESNLVNLETQYVNDMTLDFLQKEFMLEFLGYEKAALQHSYFQSLEVKKQVVGHLREFKNLFRTVDIERSSVVNAVKECARLVEFSFDPLEVDKDNVSRTFKSSLNYAVNSFFKAKKNNAIEANRYYKQKAKFDALVASGKEPEWKVVPMKVVNLEDQLASIVSLVERLEAQYILEIEKSESIDFDAKAVRLVDFFKEKASSVVYKLTQSMAKEKAIKLLEEVGIPEPRLRYNQYPFELSGGMRQRIVIAIALSANPDILICDEPTTALDVTIQSQILELINKLKVERNLSIIFITHDLGVVANMADRIAVMYAGKIVEYGTSEDLFYSPAHPYTWALLSSMPDLDTKEKLEAIPGTPPNMIYPPVGDAFAERNKYALKIDFEKQPPLFQITETHYAATWLLHPNAPKVELPKHISERIKRMKSKGGNE